MTNIASVAYAIEGPKESLEDILEAIIIGMKDKQHWTEWSACRKLGFSEEELDDRRLGGEISDEPTLENGVLRFWAEERWCLQDFEKLLREKFPGIKVYYIVEEPGLEVYCINDKEGKYFHDRYHADTCIDDICEQEYFYTEKAMYAWLYKITNGRIKSKEDVEDFNSDYADSDACYENYINIHKFQLIE